jgi:hypothetical protein
MLFPRRAFIISPLYQWPNESSEEGLKTNAPDKQPVHSYLSTLGLSSVYNDFLLFMDTISLHVQEINS